MMNEAYYALHNMRIEWDNFVGPCSDILRQWNNISTLHDNHVACIPASLSFITDEDWSILPDRIKYYILSNFPDAAAGFEN